LREKKGEEKKTKSIQGKKKRKSCHCPFETSHRTGVFDQLSLLKGKVTGGREGERRISAERKRYHSCG